MSDDPDPTERNRLDEEESPYLRQHADNPVNWQPWDEQALEAAREENKPIFLSIGYAACHWCHVMEEESFQDEAVAEVLNEHFVPIKVDREERPDLDSVYMSICQQVTGRGGWPLSAWLTPEGKPFYVGTYFPPEEKRGMPAFGDLLEDIAGSWSDPEDREEMHNRAEQWTNAIESDLSQPSPSTDGETPGPDVLETATSTAVRGADREHGGWGGGGGPKFPQPGRLQFLALAAERDGREDARAVVTETLDAMVSGGLFDHVGGGFHRYCTDQQWVVPHFEKMLYDNAEIPRALLTGYQLTGTEEYAEAAARTFAFVERELTHDEGGFYSTLGAQSPSFDDADGEAGEDEEGAFYVWTPEQVEAAVEDETDAALFCDRFGVTERGNFEGSTVLTISETVADLAVEHDLDESEVEQRLERAREQVFEARAERPRPDRDEKVLAGWNGLMISALAEGAVVLDDAYAEQAADALSFVREHLWNEDEGTLKRRYKDGDVRIDGYLEDYAFLARAALDLYQATGEVDHLAFALDLARAIEREFWDAEDETLYFTAESGESLVARPQELTDQSTPSSAGVAVQTLFALDHFADHDRFAGIAEGVLATHANDIEASPMQHASLVVAADRYHEGDLELTLVAEDVPAEWRETLADTYVPGRLLAWRPADDGDLDEWLDVLGLDEAPPIWADRGTRDGEPTVYACRNFACSPPDHEVASALDWAAEEA
ncbi:thioredoxin domain-containing protein [Halomicrobium salinisoli]|uniref:thioredoxin domain-containing protein n=1 Tax=Halomicrobium salinisoli TaxID=2878391 RepID=UPI001CF0703C|nr:thioredoxin domain-containing protein [Halomicrobium salinisoli]